MQTREKALAVTAEVGKAVLGKPEAILKIMMAMLARGHVLVEDIPGVGKTTLAQAFARAMQLTQNRVQFTPDVLPSDIVGFSLYQKETGKFVYHPGAVACNLFLADEINRTSPKTQSALLEVMEEHTVTVDGETHVLPSPFICIATQNPVGSAGTQSLPESQLDRFMICLSIGYPSLENQMRIINAQRYSNPLSDVRPVTNAQNLLEVQNYLTSVRVADSVLSYTIRLCEATRVHPLVELGISPRGVSALVKMARAGAVLRERNYVVPEDVQSVFFDVCAHRLILRPQAQVDGITVRDILAEILQQIKPGTER